MKCKINNSVCSVNITRLKLGMCEKHYKRFRLHGDPNHTNKINVDMTLNERFWSKVDIKGPDDCWIWIGGLNNKGYGRFTIYGSKGTTRPLAHRLAYIFVNGPLTKDEVTRHSCDNPPCCNPFHLGKGTQADNVKDMIARGRMNKDGLWLAPNHMKHALLTSAA